MEAATAWNCRAPSARRHPCADMRRGGGGGGGADDGWEYFPCPFCYIDIEVPSLSTHLHEEHCFDSKHAVCPICAANPGKDMISHFTAQHSHLLKRRRLHKTVEKESFEVGPFYELPSNYRETPDTASAPPDPLLSGFICTATLPHGMTDAHPASAPSHDQRLDPSMSDDFAKQDLQVKMQRLEFVQELLMSTIL